MTPGMEKREQIEQALRQATAEGLTLEVSDNLAGFRGVYPNRAHRGFYQACIWRGPSRQNGGKDSIWPLILVLAGLVLGCFKASTSKDEKL